MAIFRVQQLATQDTEMHFARFGRTKKTNKKLNRYWKENKSNNKVVCESSKAQWDYREQTTKYNLDEFIFRQNKRTTVQKAV